MPKARAEAVRATGAGNRLASALPDVTVRRTRFSLRSNGAAVRVQHTLERDVERALHNADADKLVGGRGDARFVLAVRARCHR